MEIDAKKYLQKVRAQNFTLKSLEQELSRLDYEIYHLKATKLGDKVQTSHQSDLSELVIKVESYREKINREWDALIDMRIEARDLIKQLDEEKEKCLLIERYVYGKSWESIGNLLHMSIRSVFYLHGKALHNFSKLYESLQ
jgi:hypothetical protein